jgi:hypothetical protein
MRMSNIQKEAEAATTLLALNGQESSQGLSLRLCHRNPHHETQALLARYSVHVQPFPYWRWGKPLPNYVIPFRAVVLLNIYWYCVYNGWYPPYCGWSTDDPLPNGYPRPASKKMIFHISMYLYFCKNGWEPPFLEWVCGMPLPKGYPPPFRWVLPKPSSRIIRPVPTKMSRKRKEKPLEILPSSQKKKAKKVIISPKTKEKKVNGRWTRAEHREFLSFIKKKTKQIIVKGRSASQIRSHAQKCNKEPGRWYPMKACFLVENVGKNQWFSGYYDPNTQMYVFEDNESVPRDELVEEHCVTWTY